MLWLSGAGARWAAEADQPPWTLDARELARSLGIEHVFLINDLEANGYGIPELAPESVFTLHAGDAAAVGHRGLIAAGTGLGEALLIWDGKEHRPIASEGGHCDFAARTDREIALLEYLRRKLNGRVSWERVVSGLGIQNIYAFLRDVEKMDEPAWLRERMADGRPERGDRRSAPRMGRASCAARRCRPLRRRTARRRATLR